MKKINIYIANNFLIRFAQISLVFSLLIFFINLFDAIDKAKGSEAPFYTIAFMAFLQIPDFLNDIVSSLILMSTIATFFLLSSRSEITIIRSSGFSLWQILRPFIYCSLTLGVFWVTVFGPISIQMLKKFDNLENKYIKKEFREAISPQNGIWLKQNNIVNPEEELIIQAKKVYQENVELHVVTIWFFNKDGQFYQKIDAEKMFLKDGSWLLQNATLNDAKNINQKLEIRSIPTNLEAKFVREKIVNNFQNVKLFSVFELPSLIKDLQSAGFSSLKFRIYFESLLNKPFLFMAMTLIACYFGLNHIRNRGAILMIFLGTIFGLVLYIVSSIINALGSSGLIPIFASTWVVTLVFLAIGILLIYRKENF